MAVWRLVLITFVGLSMPVMAQAARTPGKLSHHVHHVVHASKSHKTAPRTAQLHHLNAAG
jgi:hypothetical protein